MSKFKAGEHLIVGNTYTLDAGYNRGGDVILVRKGSMFGLVQCVDTGAKWETSLYRLTEKKDEQI